MKKQNLKKNLVLTKKVVSNLSLQEMNAVQGGKGVLSIGKNCTQPSNCRSDEWSHGLFCNTRNCHK